MEDPEFLILDEPMNGLDKKGIADVRKLLFEMKEQGKTMIITSHNEEDVKILCDKVIEMDNGKIV
jgi:ABC-2 type transport system ATP-binding protein